MEVIDHHPELEGSNPDLVDSFRTASLRDTGSSLRTTARATSLRDTGSSTGSSTGSFGSRRRVSERQLGQTALVVIFFVFSFRGLDYYFACFLIVCANARRRGFRRVPLEERRGARGRVDSLFWSTFAGLDPRTIWPHECINFETFSAVAILRAPF